MHTVSRPICNNTPQFYTATPCTPCRISTNQLTNDRCFVNASTCPFRVPWQGAPNTLSMSYDTCAQDNRMALLNSCPFPPAEPTEGGDVTGMNAFMYGSCLTRMSHISHEFVHFAACVSACGSVLQCAAVCCSVVQCVAVCCSVLQCGAVCCSVLQCVAVCCSVLQCVAVCCIRI